MQHTLSRVPHVVHRALSALACRRALRDTFTHGKVAIRAPPDDEDEEEDDAEDDEDEAEAVAARTCCCCCCGGGGISKT